MAQESLRLLNFIEGDLAKQLSSTSSTRLFIKIGSATTNVISSAKPSAGISATFRVSNAKASLAKLFTKSSSPTKAASLAKVGSFTNESHTDKPLFISKEESLAKSPAKSNINGLLLTSRQDAL